jgi:hypothetical protein
MATKSCQTFLSNVMKGRQYSATAVKSLPQMCELSFRAVSVRSTGILTAWILLLLFHPYSRTGSALYTRKRLWPMSVHLHQLTVSAKSREPRPLCQPYHAVSKTTGISRWIGAMSPNLKCQTTLAGRIPNRLAELTSYRRKALFLILLSSEYIHFT